MGDVRRRSNERDARNALVGSRGHHGVLDDHHHHHNHHGINLASIGEDNHLDENLRAHGQEDTDLTNSEI